VHIVKLEEYSIQSIFVRVTRSPRSNPLALAVLTCLYERPMHPYEVAQTLRSRGTHESIRLNFGSLYSVVESLERRGLISARETVRAGRRPERTIYAITDDGARELVDWLTELVASPAKEYLQFEAALALIGALPPDDAAALLRQRVLALRLQLAQSRATRESAASEGVQRVWLLEAEFMEQLCETELHFVEVLVKEIEQGSLDGLDMWRGFHADTTSPVGAEGESIRRDTQTEKGSP
jgi:DNA-binding PadR family transcriptional regulator